MRNAVPAMIARQLHHSGSAHAIVGRFAEAEASFRKALLLAPDDATVRHALAISVLAQGRYPEGFKLYAGRTNVPQLNIRRPSLTVPEWNGEDLAGRSIAIFPEQGLGDQIQFSRFVRDLKAAGADVTLLCAAPLARLFAASLGVRALAAKGDVTFPDPDYWSLIGDLPGKLGVDLAGLGRSPYLFASPAPPTGGVGVMLQGNPNHPNDAERSLPAGSGFSFDTVNLDPAQTGATDLADTAQIIAGLDLVISVDTAVAHLAGAMGKPCWIMLPAYRTDWRWMSEGTTSPWYPSARLFRQKRRGAWADVIQAVERAYAAFAAHEVDPVPQPHRPGPAPSGARRRAAGRPAG